MANEKQFAKEQLIALHNEIWDLRSSFKQLDEDDEMDHEYKRGLREAFYKVNDIIYARYKELMEEQK